MRQSNFYLLLIFGFFFYFLPGYKAQKNKKTVVNARTRFPVDYVFISSDDKKITTLTTKDGQFVAVTDDKTQSFTFYKLGYHSKTIRTTELLKTDTVFLVEKPVELEEVVIKNSKIDTIVKDKRFYVDNYLVLGDNKFLVITSKINVSGFEVCYYDRMEGITCVRKFRNEEGGHLVRDCFKNIHLVTDRFTRQIFFESDSSFQFLPKYRKTLFDSTLAMCALKLDTQVIVKETLPPVVIKLTNFDTKQNSPYLNYYRVSPYTRELFYPVRYNAHMQEMIDNAIADSYMEQNVYIRENLLALFFTRVATPLYAPLYLKQDTIVMFHFQENKIIFFNGHGSILRTVELDAGQFSTLRDFEILHDEGAQKFYIKLKEFDRSVIKQIDIYSGKSTRTVKLEKVFARNIQIVNNRIYYLVKEREWDDTVYLYQQN